MQEVLIFATVIAPIILGLVEVFKQAVNIPKGFVPVITVIVGVLVGLLSAPFSDLDVNLRLWAGALAGLSATGLFEVIKPHDGNTKGVK